MIGLETYSSGKGCCQQEQNHNSQRVQLDAELDCCSSVGIVDKATLNLLPVISNQIRGVARVAIGQVTEAKGSGYSEAGLRQMIELGTSSSSDNVSSGCGCGPSNETSALNIQAKSKFGVNSRHSTQIESNRSERVAQDDKLVNELEVRSPVHKPSQVAQQNSAAAEAQQVEKILFERESYQQTNTGSNQNRTEQPTVAGSKSLIDHRNSLSDGAFRE